MKTVEETKQDLKNFLDENPQMVEKQKEIEETLSKVQPDKRLDALYIMMMSSAMELSDVCVQLASGLNDALEKAKNK